MFSDESTFSQIHSSSSNYVQRASGVCLNLKYALKTVKHPPSLMFCGATTAAGSYGLEIFGKGTKVNAVKYTEVLETNIKIHMQLSGCTKAKVMRKWFVHN